MPKFVTVWKDVLLCKEFSPGSISMPLVVLRHLNVSAAPWLTCSQSGTVPADLGRMIVNLNRQTNVIFTIFLELIPSPSQGISIVKRTAWQHKVCWLILSFQIMQSIIFTKAHINKRLKNGYFQVEALWESWHSPFWLLIHSYKSSDLRQFDLMLGSY